MRIQTIYNLLKQENQAQLSLLDLRKRVCEYSIPLACELYSITQKEAENLVKGNQNPDFSIGQSVFSFNQNLSNFALPSDPKIPESIENKLLNLITAEVKSNEEQT